MKPISSKVLVCSLALIAALGATAAAESEGYWQPGTGVQVGGVYFHVVSVAPNSEALFRVGERLDATGLEEHPDCYRVSRTFYHRESCPVVQEHFRRYGGDANSSAPMAAPASHSSGSHPINYLQGNYQRPAVPSWNYTGLWYTPWFGSGLGHGGHFYSRPGVRPGLRPGFGPGFGGRPGFRPGYGGRPGGGFYGGGFYRGGSGAFSFRFWW